VIWLQGPQWIRWTIAIIIALAAIWTEFRGDTSVEHPFAVATITVGDPITDEVIEMRQVPRGLLPPVDKFGFAGRTFHPGEPIIPSGVTTDEVSSTAGWWALEIAVPRTARPGDPVQLVLIDTGMVIAGTVRAVADSDPLASGLGLVALPPEHAAAAASASANGRVVVLLSAG
jgi:hypothetical protein